MATAPDRRRWRIALAWSASAALLVCYALLGGSGDDVRDVPEATETAIQLPEEDQGKELLEVVEVRPGEASPGSAVEITFINTMRDRRRPLRAWLSVTDYRNGRQQPSSEMQVLHGGDDRLVLRVPQQAFEGRAKLRVGYDKDQRSKPYDLRIRAISHRKLFREVLG